MRFPPIDLLIAFNSTGNCLVNGLLILYNGLSPHLSYLTKIMATGDTRRY